MNMTDKQIEIYNEIIEAWETEYADDDSLVKWTYSTGYLDGLLNQGTITLIDQLTISKELFRVIIESHN